MAKDLLIEIGVEELPTSFLNHALASFEAAAKEAFAAARLSQDAIEVLGTPRRMALRVRGVAEKQADRDEVVTGPPKAAAFEPDGTPKKGAIGFAKKQGVPVESLEIVETDKGEYVAAKVFEAGAPAAEVLPALIAEVCAKITFPKSMRWAEGDFAFGRPIHWLVGLLGAEIVPFEFAGVTAGRTTRGHRFLAPAEFDLADASEYEAKLDAARVMVDVAKRKQTMRDALEASAKQAGGELAPDEFLLEECTSLVEWPFVVPGTIADEFLELPKAVIVSVMRDHQRYFAVEDADGELRPTYLNVVNTAESPETIAKGNDRVLRARLADAAFFVREDRKSTLESRLEKLDKVTFQKKLGSVGAKIQRIRGLAEKLAADAGVEPAKAIEAAKLSKADLDTLIVFEFPELQGLMGRYYALKEGLSADVAEAIAEHYKPLGASDAPSDSALASVVGVADRADTLVGCFGIGLVPTGSNDPFALRRAALSIIRIAKDGPIDVDVATLFERTYANYQADVRAVFAPKDEVLASLDDFVRARLRAYYRDQHAGDLVDACLGAWSGGSIRDLDARVSAVAATVADEAVYASLATAFKRAQNITKDSERGPVDPSKFEAGAEADLGAAWSEAKAKIANATNEGRYVDALAVVAQELRTPIDRFFDDVMVMVEDESLRQNRLSLLGEIADTVSRIAHFHVLST